MTGADIKAKFDIKCDEVQSDYFDDVTVQAFCDESLQNIFSREVDQFQKTQQITDNLRAFIKKVTVPAPTSNLIDISRTSTDVPTYEMIVNIPRMAFVVDNVTYAGRATQLKSQDVGGYFGQGTLYDPKYEIVDDKILCRPEGYQCSEAVVIYIAEPTQINILNSANALPYPDKFLMTVVTDMAALAGIPKKSQFDIQANLQQEQLKP